jgi:hypothetical protein
LAGLIAWPAAEPDIMVNTGNCAAVRTCPPPTGTATSGNQKLHWAISPPAYAVRDARSGGEYTGRSSATRAESTRIERVQPIHSAITVARHPQTRLQQLTDPRLHPHQGSNPSAAVDISAAI